MTIFHDKKKEKRKKMTKKENEQKYIYFAFYGLKKKFNVWFTKCKKKKKKIQV